ncbi:rod shape-determining protein RodA [Tepidibacillus infernus]|uniref:Rod shape-determining protein RodA n=1 Tax=Tepidibacillus decaturensis TaxID=1413211 RepID=A0A135L2G3_9BACI|nr:MULTISPECIES: rod shape-determining protein RodA [Tepidibacillus]KXG43063.1 rod shape-determining protein RodA [Tepidibacillus decaturensis]GBF10000.1 rod shape-determining protein RodA [Tepidibacillus sp. HK-1]
MDFSKKYLKYIDYWIIMIVIGLGVFSYFGISSAKPDSSFATKQLIWFVLGFFVLIMVLLIDYELLSQYAYFLYGIGMVLLLGLLFFADETKGITGWYEIAGIKFQPSEPMKIFTIITLARYLHKREERPFNRFIDLYPIFLIIGAPLLLILLQPDLGTGLVFITIMVSMMLVYGVKIKHFAILGSIGATGIAFLTYLYYFQEKIFFKIIAKYQWLRLTSFLDPSKDPVGSGYQVIQSLIAVGSGMLKGVGLYQGKQGKNNWVPEAHTDFIFSVIAEEHGFIGASLLILLFFLLIYRIVRIGMESKDRFGTYVAAGMVGMWVFTIYENVGMTISLMPITGIPLPFISYGGSSLLANFISLGIILNIGMRRKTLMFE